MTMKRKRGEEGTVLFAMTLLSLVISGLAVAYYQVAGHQTSFVARDFSSVHALHLAEAGIDTAIDRLNRGLPGTIDPAIVYGRGTFRVEDTDGGPGRRVLRAIGVVNGAERRVEAVVEDRPGTTRIDVASALSAGHFVYLLGADGSVLVDGRNHNGLGDQVVGMGRFGISSGNAVYALGNARVGGYGTAPMLNPTQVHGVLDEMISYGDGTDNDSDAATDEEAFNGIDDDNDGKIDEDLAGYPNSPDRFIGAEVDTLKQAAIRAGTYFTDPLQFEAHVTDPMSGWDNGGQIVYLESELLNLADFGPNLNAAPSIFVHHHPNLASIGDISGRFKGLVLADTIWHFTGGAQVVGAIHTTGYQVFGTSDPGAVVEVLYSEDVLSLLPEPTLNGNYQVISWREISLAMVIP